MVAVLSGGYRLSKRNIVGILQDFFGVKLGLGTVSALEEATSEALEGVVEEARGYVREQSVVNVDETGWKEGGKQAWLWVAVTSLVSVFVVRLSRGGKVAQELLGRAYAGVVGSDRWGGYSWVEVKRRPVCWAHLIRDFRAFVDRGGESARVGEGLLWQAKLLFQWWHRVRDGTLQRSSFRVYMGRVRKRVGELLRTGEACAHPKTARTCKNLLKVEAALWTFVRRESLCCLSSARRVERMMTVGATLRQQERNVLDYVTFACEAAIRGEAPPSLLPREGLLGKLSQGA